jgi:hypothetical protein
MTTDQDNQKDFLAWWREDFSPAVVAARRAFEPHLQLLQNLSSVINQAISSFIKEHHETIDLWIGFSKIYPQLEPHINSIVSGLKDPEFEIGNDVVQLAHVFESIDLQKDPASSSILDVISNETFQRSLEDLYASLSLDQDRLPLIKEALDLHNKRHYAGSICLLYGLIEGTLTESFEKANYILISNRKINPIGTDGKVNNKSNLTGLTPKLDHAIKHQDQLKDYYEKIKTYELVARDPDQTIPKTRNEILHGGSTSFNTEKRSAQLILWLYSSILHVQALGV